MFDRYIIGSPSLRWDDGLLFKEEAAFSETTVKLSKRVYISAGEHESGTIAAMYEMYEKIRSRKYEGLDMEIEIHADETHMTAINATVMRGLRSVHAP